MLLSDSQPKAGAFATVSASQWFQTDAGVFTPATFKEITVPVHTDNKKNQNGNATSMQSGREALGAAASWPMPAGTAVLGLLVLSLLFSDANAQAAQHTQGGHGPVMELDMPAQPLAGALLEFSRNAPARMHLVYDSAWLAGKQAPALRGSYNPRDALERLLEGSDLMVVAAEQGVIELGPKPLQESDALVRLPADDRTTVASLPQVTVMSTHVPGQTENTGLYTPDTVTVGGKTEQTLREVPRSISTITRTQLDDQGMTTLEDALEQLPGVTISPAAQWGAASYTARGFTIQNFLVDGSIVREYDAMDSSVNGSLGMYDSVQLLRGPDATFSGQGNPGGSINLTRKRPTKDFQAKTTLSAGSWSNYLGEADISSPLNASGSVRARVVASYNDREQFWDNAQSKRSLFYGVVDVDLAPRSTLTAGASKNRQWGTGGANAPGLPRYTNGDPLPLSRSTGTAAYDHRNTDVETYFGTFNHRFDNDWKLKLGMARTENFTDLRFSRFNGAVTPGKTTGTSLMVRAGETESRSNSLDFNLSGDFNWLDRQHSFVVGGDYLNTHRSDNRGPQHFIINGTSGNYAFDWANWDPSNVPELTPRQINQAWSARSVSQGVYGYGKFQLYGPFRLMLGGRYSNYKRTEDHARLPNQTIQKTTGTFTPYMALMLDITPQWSAYFTTARGIRDQSNYYTPAYEPMDEAKTRSHELGLKGELLDGRLNTNITLYDMKRDNIATRLFSDPDFDEEGRACCYVGADQQKSRGVEIDVSGAITSNWQINAGYTYDSNKQEYGAEDGQRYASFTPRHTLRLWSSYRLSGAASGWRVGGGVKAQSKAYESGTVRTWNEATQEYTGPAVAYDFFSSGRAIYNVFGAYRITPNWNLALNVDNLFDKKYFANVGSTATGNFYGAPRSYRLTLHGTF